MARPHKKCPKLECHNRQPCPVHKRWGGKGNDLPHGWSRMRKAIIQRDQGLCQVCRVRPYKQVDHIIPRAEGGGHEPSNLRCICGPCHDVKSAQERRRGILRRNKKEKDE